MIAIGKVTLYPNSLIEKGVVDIRRMSLPSDVR